MNDPTAKSKIYQQFARIGQALASPGRLEILDLLSQGEKKVEQIADGARLGLKNASAHLRTLREARLVTSRKESPYVFYGLADDAVLRVMNELQDLARRQLAEVEQITRLYFESPWDLESVDTEELLRRIQAGDVTVLDVRPADEYRAGHIPGAVSLPVTELERRLSEIPRDRPVIAYCRGPFCVFAHEAVERLQQHGFAARRTGIGVSEWRLAGHPIATQADRPEARP